MKLEDITAFTIHSSDPPCPTDSIEEFKNRYVDVPNEYLELISSATELELSHACGAYLRIYGMADAIDMDEGYSISDNLEGAVPIGDDGNSRAVFYWRGNKGSGAHLHSCDSMFPEDVIFVAPSLVSLVKDGVGAENLLLD